MCKSRKGGSPRERAGLALGVAPPAMYKGQGILECDTLPDYASCLLYVLSFPSHSFNITVSCSISISLTQHREFQYCTWFDCNH